MKGIPSYCSRCGILGEVYGCPSYVDVCTDTEACAERLAAKNRELERKLKEQSDDSTRSS